MREKLFTDGKPNEVVVDGETYYYRNGNIAMHNAVLGMMSDKSRRQQGFAKAVQFFMTDENGKPVFKADSKEDFNSLIDPEKAKHNLIRDLGMAFMGMSSDGDDEFTEVVEQEVGNDKAKPAPGSKSSTE